MEYRRDRRPSNKDISESSAVGSMAARKRESETQVLKGVLGNAMETEDLLGDNNVDMVAHRRETSMF